MNKIIKFSYETDLDTDPVLELQTLYQCLQLTIENLHKPTIDNILSTSWWITPEARDQLDLTQELITTSQAHMEEILKAIELRRLINIDRYKDHVKPELMETEMEAEERFRRGDF